ncbi:rhomboid family intramembrane serine protease [Adhaeribacter radiodurans]|uniref:Rhomboid family intramembrane serine protease n=1 Tax=Adhaeribacter radiodurans TaxID=2745197 RepID=A0A7L7L4S8_9BACT|nr:rhomboid family intramembrane serine protease [Adhaeribacter radiodurans]QMU27595.1 rhomboid family intramembrane serine protease [Adhaeribacter radiodurans]
MMNLTPMVRNLLIINVVAFLAFSYFGSSAPFALYDFRSQHFGAYQFITYMFMHGSFGHLFSNMLSLFIFGPMLEYRWGAQRFLIFYLVCGVGAGILYSGIRSYQFNNMQQEMQTFLVDPSPEKLSSFLEDHYEGQYNKQAVIEYKRNADNPTVIAASKKAIKNIYESIINIPMVGASGAVFGLLMAFGLLFPNTELFLLFFPFPIKAKYFVLFYGAYELYAGVQRLPGDNVAHYAHLGGMLFAFILLKVWERDRSNLY